MNGTPPELISARDVRRLREGRHERLYRCLGCHPAPDGEGAWFAVWAPNARQVAVVGDWNGWDGQADLLQPRADGSGIWQGWVPAARLGQAYKYRIESSAGVPVPDKADPFAVRCEEPPRSASLVHRLTYAWDDADWMAGRAARNRLDAPLSIYEVHLGSWRRRDDGVFLGYRELAHALARYVTEAGFTHVELLPVMEHPFYGSWGYQVTGYFAPTSRYGSPQDFMYLVDHLHQRGIGVILDWVPSHFPNDQHGLAYFDGTALYEHADPRQGYHPEWSSQIFNYGRHEVRAFLLSGALFWLDKYHIDGIRVDAVASMLYLDYARKHGEWVPNEYGGRENIAAIQFLRQLNEAVYRDFPDTQTIAEESTAWPMVSRPTWIGGLGFGMKWNMGWMHDTLDYYSHDPIHRKYHHDQITFSIWYAFHENFMLPISHDEVVHGKGSLVGKLPGDEWQRFANLRLLLGYMWAHPGKKLLFMGSEFGQTREWNHDTSLDWHLLEFWPHAGAQAWLRDLNQVYKTRPALFTRDFGNDGFEWVDCHDSDESIISFLRRGTHGETLLVVLNATPLVRENYRVGVPVGGRWREVLNSDAPCYGGSGQGNAGEVMAEDWSHHGRSHSLLLRLPPLGVLFFEPAG